MKFRYFVACLTLVSIQAGAQTKAFHENKESAASQVCKFTTENSSSVKKALFTMIDFAMSESGSSSTTGDEDYDRTLSDQLQSEEAQNEVISTLYSLGFVTGDELDTEWATVALVGHVEEVLTKNKNLKGQDLIEASYETLKKKNCQDETR